MERYGEREKYYFEKKGLAHLTDKDYTLRVCVDGEYVGELTVKGDCDRLSVLRELDRLGLKDPSRSVLRVIVAHQAGTVCVINGGSTFIGNLWGRSPRRAPMLYGGAFVCEVLRDSDGAEIYVETGGSEEAFRRITVLYGCPASPIHRADELRKRKRIYTNEYR